MTLPQGGAAVLINSFVWEKQSLNLISCFQIGSKLLFVQYAVDVNKNTSRF